MKSPKFSSLRETLLYANVEQMPNKLHCPLCKETDRVVIHERMGAYDGFLTIECLKCHKETHRMSQKTISAKWQPEKWGPVFFKTGGSYYKNLTKITKKVYDEQSGGC